MGQFEIIAYMKTRPNQEITREQLKEALGLNNRTIRRNLKPLIKWGKIKRIKTEQTNVKYKLIDVKK